MLNRITLMGRLTRNPELRHTANGVAVASFTLAVERNYAKDGARETDFFDIVAWRNTGEFASKYFTSEWLCSASQMRLTVPRPANQAQGHG